MAGESGPAFEPASVDPGRSLGKRKGRGENTLQAPVLCLREVLEQSFPIIRVLSRGEPLIAEHATTSCTADTFGRSADPRRTPALRFPITAPLLQAQRGYKHQRSSITEPDSDLETTTP